MNFRNRIRQVQTQIDALTLRERALLLGGVFMVMFLFWDWMLMSDITRQSKAVNAHISQVQERMTQLSETIAAAARTRGGDPNTLLQDELQRLRSDIAVLDEKLGERNSAIISPAEMAKVLENVLEKHGRLRMIAVRSLERTTLFEAATGLEGGSELPGNVYRQGLELEVEGRYLDVLAYLRELEGLSSQFFWERLVLESKDYPINRVRIVVYSLNLEEGWLGV